MQNDSVPYEERAWIHVQSEEGMGVDPCMERGGDGRGPMHGARRGWAWTHARSEEEDGRGPMHGRSEEGMVVDPCRSKERSLIHSGCVDPPWKTCAPHVLAGAPHYGGRMRLTCGDWAGWCASRVRPMWIHHPGRLWALAGRRVLLFLCGETDYIINGCLHYKTMQS